MRPNSRPQSISRPRVRFTGEDVSMNPLTTPVSNRAGDDIFHYFFSTYFSLFFFNR
jgi:hypothetical protein